MTTIAIGTPDPDEQDGGSDKVSVLRPFRVGIYHGLLRRILRPEGGLERVEVEASPGSQNPKIFDELLKVFNICLALGMPLVDPVRIFAEWRDETGGSTDDGDLRFVSSLIDYVARRVALEHLSFEERAAIGVLTVQERLNHPPYCDVCGRAMQRAGACFVCSGCGTTSGCS